MTRGDHPRLRDDLVLSRIVEHGQTFFMIKDPLTSEYMKVDETTGILAQRMDGTLSLAGLVEWANEHWPGVAFDLDYMDDTVQQFARLRYLDDPFARSSLILEKARRERSKISLSTFRNVTQIELGLIDAAPFLDRTRHAVAFLFDRRVVLTSTALFLASLVVLWLRHDHLGIPTPHSFFFLPGASVVGLIAFWLLLLATTAGHELGHAYTLTHFGGRVNYMGAMLMWGLPCLFTDTSDSHLFSNWSHKIYVALGGTYFDVLQAIAATAVWWATPDASVAHAVASRTMLFCGITGIGMNMNPFVKLDGYYVLAERLEMPELREQAFAYAGYLTKHYLLRIRLDCPVAGRRRKRILLAYVGFAFAYSASLLLLFYGFVRHTLIGWWSFAGALLSAAALFYFFKRPVGHVARTGRLWWLAHGVSVRQRRGRAIAVGAVLLAAIVLVPVPGIVRRTVTLEPARRATVQAPDALVLRAAPFTAGDAVARGETLAVLDASGTAADASAGASRAAAERVEMRARIAQGDVEGAEASNELAAAEDARAAGAAALTRRAVLRAPFAGRVLTLGIQDRIGELLPAGETLCVVADVARWRASADVDEQTLVDVAPGEQVRARPIHDPGARLVGRVESVSWEPLPGTGARRYRVWLSLSSGPGTLRAGETAVAWIRTPAHSLLAHAARWAVRWIRADLLV